MMSKDYIPREHFKSEGESLAIGQTIRINHTKCSAGEDRKKRLYVTRKASCPTLILAWCHNCQRPGIADFKATTFTNGKNTLGGVARELRIQNNEINNEKFRKPMDTLFDWSEENYDVEAISWLANYYDEVECTYWGIGYDPASSRIVIPNHRAYPTMYQLRRVYGTGARVPKYITVKDKDAPNHHITVMDLRIPEQERGKVICITEDYISATSVARSGHVGLPLFGSSIPESTLYGLVKNHPDHDWAVWLDNDNQHIKDQAWKLHGFLMMVVSDDVRVSIIQNRDDPKNHSIDAIRRILQ